MSEPLPPFWRLERFGEMFDRWEAIDHPSDTRANIVLEWIAARLDTPFLNMRPEAAIPNLWFGVIPGTREKDGSVMTCSYFILEESRTIVCNSLASLAPPFV
jgi:hypothetical protein